VADKPKELCKWKSGDYVKLRALLEEIVVEPRFVCTKCGRAANRKKRLCKPSHLGDKD